MHEDTGLYGNFAGGYLEDEAINTDPGFKGFSNPDDTSYFYAFEAGIERKWMSLGKTTIFGQYYINHGGSQDRTVGEVSSSCDWTNTSNYSSSTCNAFSLGDILSSEVESYGAGIVQGIDAAAMHLYLTYRRFEGEVKGNGPSGGATPGPTLQLDSLDVVMGGGIIRF
jgi:hypothetical protein